MKRFDKYKIEEHVYAGSRTETCSYCASTWRVNGTGRAIIATIFVGDLVCRTTIFSYDSIIPFIRKRKHKKQMLEALKWAWIYEG